MRPAPPTGPLLLALDTATSTQSLALLRGPDLLFECTLEARSGHGPDQLAMIQWLLARAGVTLHDLSGLAIGLGPGSFTGLRVGLALMKGLSFAYQKPLIGIPSLTAAALQVALTSSPNTLICPCIDARKSEVYAALYTASPALTPASPNLTTLLDPFVAPPNAFIIALINALLPQTPHDTPLTFAGSGALLYRDSLTQAFPRAHIIAPIACAHPRALCLGLLALPHLHNPPDLATLEPLYIRPSDAEIAQGHG
jgi:tRNA threonylcarbamoyladenosine biosynthesis protein TsaB